MRTCSRETSETATLARMAARAVVYIQPPLLVLEALPAVDLLQIKNLLWIYCKLKICCKLQPSCNWAYLNF